MIDAMIDATMIAPRITLMMNRAMMMQSLRAADAAIVSAADAAIVSAADAATMRGAAR